jgi:hypothetical protein
VPVVLAPGGGGGGGGDRRLRSVGGMMAGRQR